MRDYVGKYFSVEFVRKNVLRQTDREISDMNKQIKKEIDDGIIAICQTSQIYQRNQIGDKLCQKKIKEIC